MLFSNRFTLLLLHFQMLLHNQPARLHAKFNPLLKKTSFHFMTLATLRLEMCMGLWRYTKQLHFV